MKPRIDDTKFGSITIEGTVAEHDVIIRLNGQVEKRKKKLSQSSLSLPCAFLAWRWSGTSRRGDGLGRAPHTRDAIAWEPTVIGAKIVLWSREWER